MTGPHSDLPRLLRYDDWANRAALDSLIAHPQAPPRARAVMMHIMSAQLLWLARIDSTAPQLPVAPIGRSRNLQTGDWVIAIGNPYGFLLGNPEPTVTAGVVSALLVAYVIKRFAKVQAQHSLLLELPSYRLPNPRDIALGLWERAGIFMRRVGGIILALMIILWFLAAYPAPPPDATGPAIQYSFAGQLGALLQKVFAPIGFNWQISIALVPGLAAREVAVGALGTVYAMSTANADIASTLTPVIASSWSLATGLSLLAWYIFAPQCLSTLAVVRRETNSWRYPLLMAAYLFAMAYIASFATYRTALALGGG